MDQLPMAQRLRSISELEARAASQAAIGCFLLVLASLLLAFWFLSASGDVKIVGSWSTLVMIVTKVSGRCATSQSPGGGESVRSAANDRNSVWQNNTGSAPTVPFRPPAQPVER